MAKNQREIDWVKPLKVRPKPQAPKTSKFKEARDNFVQDIKAFWSLIVTIADFMAAYVLYQQDSVTLLGLAFILSLHGALTAIKHYGRR